MIKLDRAHIEKFKASWPCHGLPDNLHSIAFDFADNGDLVDIKAKARNGRRLDSAAFDGPALLALSSNGSFRMDVEYTDTFGGEANYCWVKRATLILPVGISDSAIMRRAKAAMGLTGVRGRLDSYGDGFKFVPYRTATAMFVSTVY